MDTKVHALPVGKKRPLCLIRCVCSGESVRGPQSLGILGCIREMKEPSAHVRLPGADYLLQQHEVPWTVSFAAYPTSTEKNCLARYSSGEDFVPRRDILNGRYLLSPAAVTSTIHCSCKANARISSASR